MKFFKILNKIIVWSLEGMMIFLVILTFAQVIMRYAFNSPLTWAEEIIGVVMIYFGFIGGAWGIRKRIHLAMEVFVNRFMIFLKPFADWLELFAYLVFGLLELIYGIKLMMLTQYQILPATGIKVPYTYLASVIGGIIMLTFAVELVINEKIHPRRKA